MICHEILKSIVFNMLKSLSITAILLFMASLVQAGSITGDVKFSGQVPAPKVSKTGKYSKVCGPVVQSNALLVENKRVKNDVVWVSGKGAKKLKAQPGEYHFDQKKCRYDPHVVVIVKDSTLEIHSSDPINHNIHTYSFENDPINVMFTQGQESSQEFEEPEVVKVSCDLHSWMEAWVVVTPNSYFAMTSREGSFEIKDVPPGKYTLNVWHEVLGEHSQNIKVAEDTVKINFDFSEITPQVSKN